MIRLGLIGHPLGHSLSPLLHNAALRECNLQGEYSLFPIEPDDLQGLKATLDRVGAGEITGLNVTIPHKQNVIPLLDGLTETAEAVGAVNTIYLRKERLIGDNTDALGFLTDLKKFLATDSRFDSAQHRLRHEESRALVLGAGGAARAVVYALLKDSWNVILAARRLEQARKLANAFADGEVSVTDNTLSQIGLSNIDLIVNTTPLGMAPYTEASPWPEDFPFPPRAAIYDLVYNPHETKLVREARFQGLSAITGIGMLIEQAALSFEIWTGQKPSREAMLDAADQTAH